MQSFCRECVPLSVFALPADLQTSPLGSEPILHAFSNNVLCLKGHIWAHLVFFLIFFFLGHLMELFGTLR